MFVSVSSTALRKCPGALWRSGRCRALDERVGYWRRGASGGVCAEPDGNAEGLAGGGPEKAAPLSGRAAAGGQDRDRPAPEGGGRLRGHAQGVVLRGGVEAAGGSAHERVGVDARVCGGESRAHHAGHGGVAREGLMGSRHDVFEGEVQKKLDRFDPEI
eukprot:ctg_603.g276